MNPHPITFRSALAFIVALMLSNATPLVAAAPSAEARRIGEKLDATVIPQIAFEETTVGDGVEFLQLRLAELDKSEGRTGVNFVDLRAGKRDGTMTLNLEAVPARAVLKYMCLLVGCEYVIESEAVVLIDAETWRNPGGGGEQASDSSPQSRAVERVLATASLETIDFDETELGEAIGFLRTKLVEARGGDAEVPAVNFVILDPELAKVTLDLDLRSVSVRGVLGYLMEKAGAEFTIEAGIVTIRKFEGVEPDPAVEETGEEEVPED